MHRWRRNDSTKTVVTVVRETLVETCYFLTVYVKFRIPLRNATSRRRRKFYQYKALTLPKFQLYNLFNFITIVLLKLYDLEVDGDEDTFVSYYAQKSEKKP